MNQFFEASEIVCSDYVLDKRFDDTAEKRPFKVSVRLMPCVPDDKIYPSDTGRGASSGFDLLRSIAIGNVEF